jgi:cohesin complex subunit SA-1/2
MPRSRSSRQPRRGSLYGRTKRSWCRSCTRVRPPRPSVDVVADGRGVAIGTGGKGRKAKGGVVGTSDEESGPEAEPRGEGSRAVEVEEEEVAAPVRESRARLRPRPRAVVRRPPTPSEQARSDVEMDMDAREGAEDGDVDEVVQETPKGRPRVRVREDDDDGDGLESPVKTPRAGPSTRDHPPGVPSSSLKRRRDDDADEEAGVDADADIAVGVDDARTSLDLDEVPPSEDASTGLTSPTSEFLIRRKRARH